MILCTLECKAPQIVAIDPGHDGWAVGDEPPVLIEFDFEGDTIARLGMPGLTVTTEPAMGSVTCLTRV